MPKMDQQLLPPCKFCMPEQCSVWRGRVSGCRWTVDTIDALLVATLGLASVWITSMAISFLKLQVYDCKQPKRQCGFLASQ